MQQEPKTEIAASVGAHRDLGPGYDEAIAEGLVERIGQEIDRRVDARLGSSQAPLPPRAPAPAAAPSPPAPAAPVAYPHRPGSAANVFMTLGSIGLGVGATAVATALGKNAAAQFAMVLLIWAAIAVINIAHARRRG
jgi:hypothetical protein